MQLEESEDFKTFDKLRNFGLVVFNKQCDKANCSKYGSDLSLRLRKRSSDSKNLILTWRCTRCGTFKSIYDGSFFSLFKKPAKFN